MILNKVIRFCFEKEKYFFLLMLVINIGFVFSVKFNPSMDGPAHLHNSYLIKSILADNSFLSDYFIINSTPIPNWLDHAVLSSLMFVFSSDLAEKLLLTSYIVLLAFSFRYFIKQTQAVNLLASVFVFPFIYSFLFYLGFYNYCFSIGFMFLSFGYYIKINSSPSFKSGFLLLILISLTYFSNVLGFVYLLFLLFAFASIIEYNNYKKEGTLLIKNVFKKYGFLGIVCVLPLTCFAVFYFSVGFYTSEAVYKTSELIDWIDDLRPIIAYDYAKDKKYTQLLFSLFIVLFGIAAYKFYEEEGFKKLGFKALFLVLFAITFSAYIFVPDGASAGMMSDRLGLMLFFVFLALLVQFPLPKPALIVAVCFSVYLQFSLYLNNHRTVVKDLNRSASQINAVAQKMDNRKIVLPINMSENWLELHFSNYLGVQRELVILENYEASVGWFPLKWNTPKMPNLMLGDINKLSNISWPTNDQAKLSKKIDYVVIYGNTSKIESEAYTELKQKLNAFYNLEHVSENNFIKLYHIKP